jgi:hypothetical protein
LDITIPRRCSDKSIVPAIGSKRLFEDAMTAGLTATNPVMALPMRHVHRARSRDRARQDRQAAPGVPVAAGAGPLRGAALTGQRRQLADGGLGHAGRAGQLRTAQAGLVVRSMGLSNLARRDRPRSAEPAIYDELKYAGLPAVVVNG